MAQSPYFNLIQKYFPESEWDRADCISVKECSPSREGYPSSCVVNEGLIRCGGDAVPARSWGIFQILDACWNPDMNPNSPFTREQWAQVLEPEMNTWMASVIWSRAGWQAWSTCDLCNACDVPGGTIPYPNGPAPVSPPPEILPTTTQGQGSTGALLLGGLGLIVSGILLYYYRDRLRGS
jgi:hypothetical protein